VSAGGRVAKSPPPDSVNLITGIVHDGHMATFRTGFCHYSFPQYVVVRNISGAKYVFLFTQCAISWLKLATRSLACRLPLDPLRSAAPVFVEVLDLSPRLAQ